LKWLVTLTTVLRTVRDREDGTQKKEGHGLMVSWNGMLHNMPEFIGAIL